MSAIVVPPVGPLNAKIAIVGESPGQDEEFQRVPFVGASGKFLNMILSRSKISRSDCYITNVSKIRIPNFDILYEDGAKKTKPREELIMLHESLRAELSKVKANVFVALGNEALYALTGLQKISLWRGSILEAPGIGKCIATYHPSYVLRSGNKGKETYSMLYATMLFDFARIKRESEFPEIRRPEYLLLDDPTYDEVMAAFDLLDKAEIVAFDIEVTNMEIDHIAFSPNKNFAISIPFVTHHGVPRWTAEEELMIWKRIAGVLENPAIGKVAQNASFDITFLERHGVGLKNLAMDTMTAHNCCYSETPRGLEYLCSIYTDIPYYKNLSNVARGKYNALDALVTRMCYDALVRELKDLGTYDFYFNFINKTILPYKEIANAGVNVDIETRDKIKILLEEKISRLTKEFHALTNSDINLESPKQVADLLYGRMGFKGQKTEEGKLTTNEEALKNLVKMYAGKTPAVAAVELLLEVRRLTKLLNTYVKSPIDPDKRIRTTYMVSGTETGRLSSKKALTGTGMNLQNISKEEIEPGCGFGIRSFIIPDSEDDFLIEGDLMGADARIVAWDSRDPALIALFSSGRDIHIANAALFYHMKEEDLLERYKNGDQEAARLRRLAKTCTHAANYGVGARKMAIEAGIPEHEAKRLLETYYTLYPGIKNWHFRIQEQLKKTRTLVTPLGRKRFFFGRWGDELFKEAYAFIPQSSVADVIHRGFLNLYESIKERGLDKLGVRILMNNHDALTVNCPASLVDQFLPIMKKCMEIPLYFLHGTYTIPVDLSIGKNWFNMTKVKLDNAKDDS